MHIVLADVEPLVWRRLLIPGSLKMDALVRSPIAAMGWQGIHLYRLQIGSAYFVSPDEDDLGDEEISADAATLHQALLDVTHFEFIYDLGDCWSHQVTIEKVSPAEPALQRPVCLEGANACPPEDVGGSSGYARFLHALSGTHGPEYRDYLEWCGGAFDPGLFDLCSTNARCQRIR
jgi:hypothetical protein